jgi:lysophospholipase L1-like esterase
MLPRKTALAIATFVLIAVLAPNIPGKEHLPGISPRAVASAFTLRIPWPEARSIPAPAAPTAVPVKAPGVTAPAPSPDLTVPPGSLDRFFKALRRAEARRPGAVVRVLHYGDSPTTADSITADVRKLLQRRFGDAGHGFLLIAKPWAWYGHNGIGLDAKGWEIAPASQARAADGFHGLGGVSFRGESGAYSRVTLPDDRHTRATVYYLGQPGGGSFSVMNNWDRGGAVIAKIDTGADEKRPGFAEFALPDGTQTIELRVTTGRVRLFGYRFDKDQPGVQYSSLGVNGAQVQMVVRYFEAGQWTAALRHENPDLVVVNYGTNESIFPEYIEKQYPDELRSVVARIREALPDASLLIMSPMDRGVPEGGDIVTPPALEKLIDVQKQIAAETGCAFFNTFEAMGGAGTMGRWYREQPRLVSADFMHPLPPGAAKVGALFEKALVAAYESSPQ